MTNPVAFTPTLAQFRAAAGQLNANQKEGATDELRFKALGTGLAVNWLDRFLVRVADFFSSAETVAQRKAAVLTAFLEAVRVEQGDITAAFAECEVQPAGTPQTKLSSRAVGDVMAQINQFAKKISRFKNDIEAKNELAIRKAAYGIHGNAPRATADMPALAGIVDAAAKKLLDDASRPGGLLTEDDLAALQTKYVGAAARQAGQNIDKLSRAIEKRLRDKLAVHSDAPRLLSPRLISVSGSLAVKSIITPEINGIALANYEKSHPFKEAFSRAADHANLPQNDPRRSDTMLAAFAAIEAQKIQAAKFPQTAKEIEQAREALIAQVLAHGPALAWVAANVPNGPEKTGMLAQCLDLAPDVDATYFTQVGALALATDACVAALPKQSAEGQQTAWLQLSESLSALFSRTGLRPTGTNDTNRFSKLGTDLFIARAEPRTLRALGAWMHSDQGQAVMHRIADLQQQPYYAASENMKERILQAGDASFFLLELQKAASGPATPTLAEIVDAAAQELLGKAATPSDLLTENDLDRLRRKYLGTAPKLPPQQIDANIDKFSRAVETKLREIETDANGAPRPLTPDRILNAGKRTVKAHLTSEINGIVLANYEKSHPFKTAFIEAANRKNLPPDDPRRGEAMLAAFAKIERHRALAAAKPQTTKDIEQARGGLIEQVLARGPALAWVADNVPDGPYQTDMIDACLNLSPNIDPEKYFAQVKSLAQDIDGYIAALPRDKKALETASQTLGERVLELLLETGLKQINIDDFNAISRLGANLFAVGASPETLGKLRDWIGSDTAAEMFNTFDDWANGSDPEFTDQRPERVNIARYANAALFGLQRIASVTADA